MSALVVLGAMIITCLITQTHTEHPNKKKPGPAAMAALVALGAKIMPGTSLSILTLLNYAAVALYFGGLATLPFMEESHAKLLGGKCPRRRHCNILYLSRAHISSKWYGVGFFIINGKEASLLK